MASIWLAHLTVYDPTLPGLRTLYFSSQGFTSGATPPPGGVAHTAYEPRIQQPAVLRRDCFDRGTTGGESRVGYGALELVNLDGGLDYLADLGIDGQPISLILGSMARNGAPVWETVLVGTVEQPAIGWSSVTLRLRDRQAELAKPLSAATFAGTNALPAGLEGVDDIKGKTKPVCFGKVFNVSPPMVNTSRLIYQVSTGAISTVSAVYDRGLGLSKGADYASQADMETTAPSASTFRVWPAGGYFRLGSSPTGIVTADVTQGASASDRTTAQLIKQIALSMGIAAGDINAADVTALDAANSAEVGYWTDSSDDANEALDDLANSIGAWWGFDRLGKLRMQRFEAPSGTPVAYLEPADIIRIDRVANNDAGRGIPAWKVTLGYKKFFTTQPNDLAGAVAVTRRQELAKDYRTVEAEDAAIKTRHTLATPLEFDTLLIDATAAQTECTRRLNLYKAERATITARLALDASLISSLDLGVVVRLTLPRFGMAAGRDFRVIGLQPDYKLRLIDVTLWG